MRVHVLLISFVGLWALVDQAVNPGKVLRLVRVMAMRGPVAVQNLVCHQLFLHLVVFFMLLLLVLLTQVRRKASIRYPRLHLALVVQVRIFAGLVHVLRICEAVLVHSV